MSEFSDSVHLLGGDVTAAVESLQAIGATALVLPKARNHVTVLVGVSNARRWSAATKLPLLTWRFAADHLLDVALFHAGKRVAGFTRDAETGAHQITGARAWHSLATVDPTRLESALDPASSGDLNVCAQRAADLLGISDFEWASSRALRDADGLEDLRSRFPRAIYLRSGKRARWTTAAEADTLEREKREWEVEAREVVTGAPLLAPPKPPVRRGVTRKADPPWVIRRTGAITLDIENFGGEARGVTLDLESPLLAGGACVVDRATLDDVQLVGALSQATWRATDPTVLWPAATNPGSPEPVKTHRLTITMRASATDRGQLLVRVVPAASPDGRGRFLVGRLLEVGP